MYERAMMRKDENLVVGKLIRSTNNKGKAEARDFFLNKRKDLPPLLKSKHLLLDFTIRMNNHKLQKLGDEFAAARDPDSKTIQMGVVGQSEGEKAIKDEKGCRQQGKCGEEMHKGSVLWGKEQAGAKRRRYTDNGHTYHYNFIDRDEKSKSRSIMKAVAVRRQDESMTKLLKRISVRRSIDSGNMAKNKVPHPVKALSVSLSRSESERVQPQRSISLARERSSRVLGEQGLNDCIMLHRSQLGRLNLGIVSNLQQVSPWKQQLNQVESYCLTPAKDWEF